MITVVKAYTKRLILIQVYAKYEAYYFRKNVDNGIQCDTIELFKRHLIKLINI